MKIQIKLLSDLCTCSGETYNSIVDTDVTYDENGIPYIPAKRIRGCIREAGLEMLEFGLISGRNTRKYLERKETRIQRFHFQMHTFQIMKRSQKHCKKHRLRS